MRQIYFHIRSSDFFALLKTPCSLSSIKEMMVFIHCQKLTDQLSCVGLVSDLYIGIVFVELGE